MDHELLKEVLEKKLDLDLSEERSGVAPEQLQIAQPCTPTMPAHMGSSVTLGVAGSARSFRATSSGEKRHGSHVSHLDVAARSADRYAEGGCDLGDGRQLKGTACHVPPDAAGNTQRQSNVVACHFVSPRSEPHIPPVQGQLLPPSQYGAKDSARGFAAQRGRS